MENAYDKFFGRLTDEDREKMIEADIPLPRIVGKHELTDEDKRLAEEWLAEIIAETSKQSEK